MDTARNVTPRHVAVIGAGAVGGYYGAALARSGTKVTMIGRAAQVEAMHRDGLVVVQAGGEWQAKVHATADPAALADADLVLVAVKSQDTDAAADEIARHARPDCRVLSMQNGVDNAERIAACAAQPVYAAVVYVGADMDGPGRVRHTGRGDLLIGLPRRLPPRADAAADLAALAHLFESAAVKCPVSADIDAALWSKLTVNCAYNAISAVCAVRYGVMVQSPAVREVMQEIVREVVRVAAADRVALDEGALLAATFRIAENMPDQYSSTAQDVQRRKTTEIDAINGFVVRRSEALGVPAPINRTLHALVKLRELQYTLGADGRPAGSGWNGGAARAS